MIEENMNNVEYEERITAMNTWADSVRNELVQEITNKPQEIIFHYTDINGLIGLISTGCVWATHSSRLNDSSENKLGFKLVANHVQDNLVNSSKQLLEKVLLRFQSTETYIACYSTESNLLGQWRNYTGEKVGYSLGFETKYMATIDDRMPPLEQVIYNDNKAKALIDILLSRVDEFLNQQPFGEVEVGYLLGMIEATLSNIACIIKHQKFEEEHEYRHIYQPENTKLKLKRGFRNGQFGLTPYVEVGFMEKNKLPLKTITIGPCQSFEQESNALKLLLTQHKYENVEVIESGIPPRV